MPMREFISNRSAELAGSLAASKHPGAFHRVERRSRINADRTMDLFYVVKLFDKRGQVIGAV